MAFNEWVQPLIYFPPLHWSLEYTVCILCRGEKPSPPTKRVAVSMTLNCVWWWGSNSEDLGSVEYYFFAIIGLAVRVFANGPGDLGSIPGRIIPKTQKMVLDASLLNTQHYKVRIKGKVEPSREGVAPSPTSWCSSYRKGSLRVTLDYGRQLYFLLHPGSLWPEVLVPVRVTFWGQIDLFKNYLYSTEPHAKKKKFLRNDYTKNLNMNAIP